MLLSIVIPTFFLILSYKRIPNYLSVHILNLLQPDWSNSDCHWILLCDVGKNQRTEDG